MVVAGMMIVKIEKLEEGTKKRKSILAQDRIHH
jgi:hypothetical protein